MNLSGKGAFASDSKLMTLKSTSLNPHAAEFVPFALQSSSRSVSSGDSSSKGPASTRVTLENTVLDRSESSISNNSDDEVRQYWRQQLPDDITPDFNVVGEDEPPGLNNISLSGLSISNAYDTTSFSASAGSALMFKVRQELSPRPVGENRFTTERMRAPLSYGKDPSAGCFQSFSTNSWDDQHTNKDQLIVNVGVPQLNGNVGYGFLPNMLNEQMLTDYTDINPVELLSSRFPDFSAESLGEVYFANGGDLNLTIEMLTQLELQIDGGQNGGSKAVPSKNLSALDFPALSAAEGQNGIPKFSHGEVQQNANSYRPSNKDNMLLFRSSSSVPSKGHIDFASAVRKMASQDPGIWKFDRNGSSDLNVGSSRSSHVLPSSYSSGQGRGVSGDRLQPRASRHAAPVWLETGEAVANMYSEIREDARDHARLRNAYFEQARKAYLIGNKALAKELSVKGQLHNMQMKEAHGNAQESIYRQRNPGGPRMQDRGSGHERLIDLHGLHVSEAIHILKRELAVLRSSAAPRLQVYICVGTGHHTRGSRTPARLPIAVRRYLLEEEGLDYSEPQPGLLRVVIY